MWLITSHLNLDFDGYASAHLMTLLYPESVLVFPGAKEAKLRAFEQKGILELPDDTSPGELPQEMTPTGIIVTDTSDRKRLGMLADLLDRVPREQVILVDHHAQGTIEAGTRISGETGATTTLVVELLREKGIDIPGMYATLGLMGIYEDTDFLSFPETTARDAEAVAYLLRQGADLNDVTSALKHQLSPRQVDLFNRMIPLLERFEVNGREMAVVQYVAERFEPDVSSVMHRVMEIEQIKLFFCVIQMQNKTFLMARNLYPDINLKTLFKGLVKGGGHRNIFTGTFREKTVFEVRQVLDEALERIPSAYRARDLAQPPVRVLKGTETIREVFQLMNRLRINSLPVGGPDGGLTGAVTRQDVDYAMVHDMGEEMVTAILRTDIVTVDGDTGLEELRDLFLNSNSKLAFVRNGPAEPPRIITRTAAFKQAILVSETRLKPISYAERLRRFLPKGQLRILLQAGSVADEMGTDLFIVGGFVRDLLLRRRNEDLDLVVGSDGIAFAKRLAQVLDARCVPHEAFQTAVLILPDGSRLDVATSRFEYYRKPGALPEITAAHVFHDLYRRDFTINAMAIRLNRAGFGELIDYFGGRRDLKEGVIRVLHSLSFVDDPTRMLRAIRFKHRFRFRIGRTTLSLMKSAAEMGLHERVSGYRFQKEIRLLFSEANASVVLEDLEQFGGLRFFHPDLVLEPYVRDLATAVDSVVAWHRLLFQNGVSYWLLYLFSVLIHASPDVKKQVCAKLALKKRISRQVLQFRSALRHMEVVFDRYRGQAVPEPVVDDLFRTLEPEIQLFALAYFDEETVKRAISHYVTDIRDFPVYVNGNDVLAAGVTDGRRIREILERVRQQAIARDLDTREAQLALLREMTREG